MSLYYFIFIWLAFWAVFSQYVDVKTKMTLNGQKVYRWSFFFAIVLFVPVMYLAAFTAPRSDTQLYLQVYEKLPVSWSAISEQLKNSESGQGFLLLEWFIKKLFNGSVSAFRIILMLLHSIPILYIYRRYSDDFILSLFIFLATGCHLAWMMNGMRQFLAVSIIMAATPLMLKKQYIPLIIVILFATTIHTSAIIMLPIVFIVQGKPWNEKTILFIVLSIVMMYLFSKYTGLLDSLLVDTEYAGAMANATEIGDDGTNPIRVLVSSVPMILAFIGREQIGKENDGMVNLCINMSIVTVGIYLVSMVTSGIMIGRLPIYTALYSYMLLPHLVKTIFTKRSAKLVTVMMIILYFAYYLYAYFGY